MIEEISELEREVGRMIRVFTDEGRKWLRDLRPVYGRRVLAAFRLDTLTEVAGVSAADSDVRTTDGQLKQPRRRRRSASVT